MASRLIGAGFTVTLWNRSPGKVPAGAHQVATPAQAVGQADVALVMLCSGPVCADVLFSAQGAARVMQPGAALIVMSSIGHDEAKAMAIQARGLAPVFAPLGKVTHVGPDGAGALTKLINQLLVAQTICAVSAALQLARHLRLPLLAGDDFPPGQYHRHGSRSQPDRCDARALAARQNHSMNPALAYADTGLTRAHHAAPRWSQRHVPNPTPSSPTNTLWDVQGTGISITNTGKPSDVLCSDRPSGLITPLMRRRMLEKLSKRTVSMAMSNWIETSTFNPIRDRATIRPDRVCPRYLPRTASPNCNVGGSARDSLACRVFQSRAPS